MEQTNQKPLQKEKKPRSLGRTAGLIAGIAVGVLAAAYIAVCAAAAAGGEVELTRAEPQTLTAVLSALEEAGWGWT